MRRGTGAKNSVAHHLGPRLELAVAFATSDPVAPELGAQDLSGNSLSRAPEWKYSLGLECGTHTNEEGQEMNIAELKAMPSLDSIISDIERYGLAQNAVELMTYGFTVVSPETLGVADAWIERLRDAAVAAYEKRNNVSVDFRTSTITTLLSDAFYDEDEVFIEAAINPAKLALVRLMLGQGAVLRTNSIILKGTDIDDIFHRLPLHTDDQVEGIPMGAGQICHRLNCSWICTDYIDEADGPTLFVPASQHFGHSVLPHRQRRHQHTLSDRAPRGRGRLGGDVARGHVSQHFAAHPDWAASNAERELHPPLHSGPPRQTLHRKFETAIPRTARSQSGAQARARALARTAKRYQPPL